MVRIGYKSGENLRRGDKQRSEKGVFRDRTSAVLLALVVMYLFLPKLLPLFGLNHVDSIARVVGIASLALLFYRYYQGVKFDLTFFFTLLFCTTAVLLTLIHGEFTGLYVEALVSFLVVWMVVKIGLENGPHETIKIIGWILAFFVVANVVSIMPNLSTHLNGFLASGEGEIYTGPWLLDYKNALRNWIIPMICCHFLMDYFKGGHVSARTIILSVVGIVSLILADSAASIGAVVVQVAVLTICIEFRFVRHANKITKTGIVIWAGALFSAIFLRSVPLLGSVIQNLFDRSATFTGRTALWDIALRGMVKNPFGVGYHTGSISELVTYGGHMVNHAHNAALDTGYKYGVLGVFAALAVLIGAFRSLMSLEDKNITLILGVSLLCFLISGIFGELFNAGFLLILYLSCYCGKISGPTTCSDSV